MLKKLVFSISLLLFFMFLFSSTANAQNVNESFSGTDEKINTDSFDSIIKDGTTFVPIRAFSNSLNAEVYWHANSGLVEIIHNGKKTLIESHKGILTDENGSKTAIALMWRDNRIYGDFTTLANVLSYPISDNPSKEDGPSVQTSSRSDDRIAFLTFDDGPNKFTSQILDILLENDAKATFFMLYGNIETFSNVVNRMIAEGHAVGSHSVTHDKEKFYRSRDTVLNEMDVTREEIERITGMETFLMRVPYGSHPYMKTEYKAAVSNAGYIMWDWNVDSEDWRYPKEPDRIVELTINQIDKLESQGKAPVIIFHDKDQTVKALPMIIHHLKKKGYRMEGISPNDAPVQFR